MTGMRKLVIFSAFPQELLHIVRNATILGREKVSPFDIFVAQYASCEAILVLTGMKMRNADFASRFVLEKYRPDIVVSSGFGGALYDGAMIGDLVYGTSVFLVKEGLTEEIEINSARDVIAGMPSDLPVHEGSILTLMGLMRKTDIKKILSPDLSCPVCDMETFYLAKLSGEQGLPFIAIRSITDRAGEEIPPEFLAVSDESGRYGFSRALRLILLKPWLIPEAVKLGINSTIASRNLWRFVKGLIGAL